MQQLLLLSILIATVVIPSHYAKVANPFVGLKKLIKAMTLFLSAYVLALIFIYPRLF